MAETVRRLIGVGAWLLPGLLFPAAPLSALDPAQRIAEYAHSVWSRDNGLFPSSIVALTQTRDGTLWIGTDAGLQQFDGVRFQPWQPPSGQALASSYVLALAPDGASGLWIGTREGLSHWQEKQIRNYKTSRGPSGPVVTAVVVDKTGTMWAATGGFHSGGLCRLEDGALRCTPLAALPEPGAISLFADRSGSLWVGGFGLCHAQPGRALDCPFQSTSEIIHSIAEDAQGGIWAAGSGVKRLTATGLAAYAPLSDYRHLKIKSMLIDRDGGLWIGSNGQGLLHVYQGRTDAYRQADGLSSDYVRCLFEDREGNIWAGTDGGLDRFRQYAVTRISRREGIPDSAVNSLGAARDGAVWIASGSGLSRLQGGAARAFGHRDGLPSGDVVGVFAEQSGRLWAFTLSGVAYLDADRFHLLSPPAGSRMRIRAAAETTDHSVWLSDPGRGLTQIRNAHIAGTLPWSKFLNRQAWSLEADPDGGLWLGFAQGQIAYYKPGQEPRWFAAPGRSAAVTDLQRGRDGSLWAATKAGLGRLRGQRLDFFTTANGLPCNGVRALVEDGHGALWLHTDCGLVLIPRAELDSWSAHPEAKAAIRVFDAADGMRRSVQAIGYSRQAVRARDGRLWFVSQDGAAVVNPDRLPSNRVPPPVKIEEIAAGSAVYPAGPGLKLPPSTRELRIQYAAMSFAAPEKVRFRYRLEGFDKDWKDDAGVRQAVYMNLPPHGYTFHVIACNNDGVWNRTGASLDFQIEPAFHQTRAFQLLCLLCVAGVVWLGYRVRLRQMRHRMSMQFEAQMQERTRIAREMHDTLLQELNGCALLLEGLAKTAGLPGVALRHLQEIKQEVLKCAREAREFVWDLRAPTIQEVDLSQALRAAGEQITHGGPVRFHVTVQGQPRPAPVKLQQQLLRIVQEATRNAVRYSRAKEIFMDLVYLESDKIRLSMRDDGCGFDPEEAARASGHWGLRTMRERAEQLGGELKIRSSPGHGTSIDIVVPIAAPA